ncbi:hypothetical protein C6P45_000167 [Maudiozyma exigua]|uniref:SCD domain-containing protein n=1 Tax=Maudiozyma exigua TaxID=34358 RepID=A0A9P7B9X1_MAUEX|nr:hypothetical protein C6P45_000167 [Kazachstania exigua]
MPPKHSRTRTKRPYQSDDESPSNNSSNGIQNVREDEDIALEDDEVFDSEESSEEDNDNVRDGDYFPTVIGERKAKAKKVRQERANKKRKKLSYFSRTVTSAASTETREEQDQYLEMIKEFEHTELFTMLATADDISIEEITRELLDEYSNNRDEVIKNIINLLLDCCGAMTHVEDHDIHNNESASDTLSELQLSFQKQKLHEFNLLISKQRKRDAHYKPLYQNFIEFMSKLLEVADDLQLLYNEDDDKESSEDDTNEGGVRAGQLVLDLLTWFSVFSVSKIRCFRYVSTLSLYIFQDYLSTHAVSLEKDYLARLTKQLNMEKKKKRPNSKTVETLEENIEEVQNNKAIIDNILDNIVRLCFVNRFKDVDEAIRTESMHHLAIWIHNNPEYFMKVTYLKYFGWLLSDSSVNVRLEILHSLPLLIKSSHHASMVDNPAIRQFFERFKSRILEIAVLDSEIEVSINAINVLIEASSLDYLEDPEILTISSLIFDNEDTKVSSTSKTSRLMATVAKFLARVINQKYETFINSHKLEENISSIKTSVIVKIGIIIRLLNSSLLYYVNNSKKYDPSTTSRSQILFQAAEFLYPFFGSQVDTICQLLSDDNEFIPVYEEIVNSAGDNNNDEMEIDNEEQSSQISIDKTPLLPMDNDNVAFYVIVLSGLCEGGMNGKSQNSNSIALAVLPHLEKLLKNLSEASTYIFLQILNIFNLFNFDRWVHAGCEKKINNINSMILKGFSGIVLMHTNIKDNTFDTFSKTIAHIKELHLKDIDNVWINEISMIKLQLEKYLTEKNVDSNIDFGEFTNTIYSQYVNRLVLLGKQYPLEFSPELLKSFLDKFMSKLPHETELNSIEDLTMINFKLPVILVASELKKWLDIIENNNANQKNDDSNNERNSHTSSLATVKQALSYISGIVVNMESILIEFNHITGIDELVIHNLRYTLASSLIDVLVALKCFDLQLPEEEVNWRDLLNDTITESYLNDEIYNVLLDTFLYLESSFARDQNVQLDRGCDEDVTLNGLTEDNTDQDSERELLVYTVKLMGLMKLDMLDEKVSRRISLNKEILGPIFKSVIDDSIFHEKHSNNGSTRNNLRGSITQLPTSPVRQLSRDPSDLEVQSSGNFMELADSDSSNSGNSNNASNRKSRQLMNLNVIEENSEEAEASAI